MENAAIPAEAGAPTPLQQHDYSPMDSGLPLRPKQLGGAQARPESFGAGRDDTQPGDFDAISQPAEDVAGAGGDPRAHRIEEDGMPAAGTGRQAANQRGGVTVVINKNNSTTAQQREQQNRRATRQRLDIGDMIIDLGTGPRGSAGRFDLAAGLLSDGCLSPAPPMAEHPQRKAVRLKGSLARGYQWAAGDHEAPLLGVHRYAKAGSGFDSENKGVSKAGRQQALRMSPHGAILDVGHIHSERDGFMTMNSEQALEIDTRGPPAFLKNSLSLNLGTLAQTPSQTPAALPKGSCKPSQGQILVSRSSYQADAKSRGRNAQAGVANERADHPA